jgi:hypothetical protein
MDLLTATMKYVAYFVGIRTQQRICLMVITNEQFELDPCNFVRR